MSLDIQIKTLLFSLIFGIFFSLFTEINYKLIHHNKKILRIIFSFMFIIVSILIYFIFLEKINNAYLHPYFILMIILGVLIEIMFHKLIEKIKLIWYNRK